MLFPDILGVTHCDLVNAEFRWLLVCVTIRYHSFSVADQLCVGHSYCALCIYACVLDISLLSLCGFTYVIFLYIIILVSFYQKLELSAGGGSVMGDAV